MNTIVFIGPESRYQPYNEDVAVFQTEFFRNGTVSNTDSFSTSNKDDANTEFAYSRRTNSRFALSSLIAGASIIFSILAVVFELKTIGIVGAFLMAAAFLSFYSWVKIADDERNKAGR